MFTADIHCDALLQMEKGLSFNSTNSFMVNGSTLKEGKVNVQNFALFTMPHGSKEQQRQKIFHQIKLFNQFVVSHPQITWEPGKTMDVSTNGTKAILSLEGAGMFGDTKKQWENLKKSGVEIAGLTWNEKNSLAAGSGQSNKYGLTKAGKRFVSWMNDNQIILDAAHLNENSFWGAIESGDHVVVTHANIRSLCDHPRNLYDSQIQALQDKNSFLGLTFYPPFINGSDTADYSDLAHQIEYACERGASEIVGFGSDFDGINQTIKGMTSPAHYPHLIDWLLKRFDEDIIRGIAGENFKRFWNKTKKK